MDPPRTSRLSGSCLFGAIPSICARIRGSPLDAHGGYLIRVESLSGLKLLDLARRAIEEEGLPSDTQLSLAVYPRRKVVRLAFEGVQTAGRWGSHWYSEHQALARLLSRAAGVTVHSYVYDPIEYEEVMAFGAGQHVGGERLLYEQVELPECVDGEFDDEAFARMQARWPLGHLAWVYGVERELLLRLHKMQGTRVGLDGSGPESESPLEKLLRGIAA